MSLNKPTCILSCPLVEKFFENGCSTFVATSNMSFSTNFDGHNVDHNIEICADGSVFDTYVTFNLTPTVSWCLTDINDQKKDFLEMFEQLENSKDITRNVSGGGNSRWNFGHDYNEYCLYFDISGMGGDSHISVTIPEEQGDECIRIMKKVYQTVESQ